MASFAPEEAEVFHTETRQTRDGRKITYEAKVIQNPEKARACGQGAKSSTDRRPVDPPPIIQLQIFDEEGEPNGGRKDITFHYRANFFMYAELENARILAHPHRAGREFNEKPILCGSPVSGISYLDKPLPAGYFIFPDLSVRHEGRYRLSFTLWEETKDRGLEDPTDEASSDPQQQELVISRCQVKSLPFTVYSAKKFPGLSESTGLSKAVADQGCRVRIRRDVRMRRRETKDSKPGASDDEDMDTPKVKRRHTSPELKHKASQEELVEPVSRPRSPSTVSNTAMQRTSGPDLNTQYHQQSYPTHQMMAPSTHHGFPQPPPPPSAAAPPHQFDPAGMQPQYGQYMHEQTVMQSSQGMSGFPPPPPGPYHSYHPFYPQYGPYGYMPPQQMQQSPVYAPHTNHLRHESVSYVQSPQDYQAAPGLQQLQNPPQSTHYHTSNAPSRSGSIHSQHPLHPQSSPAQPSTEDHTSNPKSLPHIQTQQPYQHHAEQQQPMHHRPSYDSHPHALNPQATPFYPSHLQQHQHNAPPVGPPPPPYAPTYQQPPVPPPPQYMAPASAPPMPSKRSFASSFDTGHIDQRLQSGARPDVEGAVTANGYQGGMAVADVDEEDEEPMYMEYKRADGTMATASYPALR